MNDIEKYLKAMDQFIEKNEILSKKIEVIIRQLKNCEEFLFPERTDTLEFSLNISRDGE